MDAAIQQVLAELEQREVAENEIVAGLPLEEYMRRRDEFLIPIGNRAGMLLNILVKESRARRILELGVAYGYSTVWLAEAARENKGEVVSIEIVPHKLEIAHATLVRAGLSKYVDLRLGDASQIIPSLEGSFDFVLLDLWKELYIPSFDLFYPKLKSGAFIAADNMLFPERYRDHARAYRAHVRSKPGISSLLLPVGNGVELSRYDADGTVEP
jgi:predicted O-methyltransferase YrrM